MIKSIPVCAAVLLALTVPAAADDAPKTVAAETIEIPQAVKDACKDDYDKNCSAHVPGSPAARDCMVQAFEKLSEGCVAAILDSTLAETAAQDVANAQKVAHAPPDAPAQQPRRRAHSAPASKSIAKTHHEVRTAQASPSKRSAKARRDTHERTYAHHSKPAHRNVAGYIKRGTGIANYYVAKYTRFALAKVFH